jgi:hypothetical protein
MGDSTMTALQREPFSRPFRLLPVTNDEAPITQE